MAIIPSCLDCCTTSLLPLLGCYSLFFTQQPALTFSHTLERVPSFLKTLLRLFVILRIKSRLLLEHLSPAPTYLLLLLPYTLTTSASFPQHPKCILLSFPRSPPLGLSSSVPPQRDICRSCCVWFVFMWFVFTCLTHHCLICSTLLFQLECQCHESRLFAFVPIAPALDSLWDSVYLCWIYRVCTFFSLVWPLYLFPFVTWGIDSQFFERKKKLYLNLLCISKKSVFIYKLSSYIHLLSPLIRLRFYASLDSIPIKLMNWSVSFVSEEPKCPCYIMPKEGKNQE